MASIRFRARRRGRFRCAPRGRLEDVFSQPPGVAKKQADAQSYPWDELIEYQSGFIRAGTAASPIGPPTDVVEHERIVRAMAQQTRLARRTLAADLHFVLSKNPPEQMFARVQVSFKSQRVLVRDEMHIAPKCMQTCMCSHFHNGHLRQFSRFA